MVWGKGLVQGIGQLSHSPKVQVPKQCTRVRNSVPVLIPADIHILSF